MPKKRKPKKKETEMQKATTYCMVMVPLTRIVKGKTHKRIAKPGTKRGKAYCARTVSQKRTAKVKVRRQAWGCSGKNSYKKKK